MKAGPVVGIVAPSSKVPAIEFELGLAQLREAGFELKVHPQCRRSHLFFAGTDEERARAFLEYALDPAIPVIWCARGGYGIARFLAQLEKLSAGARIPRDKLLVGYSDATALIEFARRRWGWAGLHAQMPGLRKFCALKPAEWRATTAFARGERVEKPWGAGRVRFVGPTPAGEIIAPVTGGNLTLWNSLIGTRFAGLARDQILFFEDIGEALYRIDRMLQQILDAGGFEGVRAIVLGDFYQCKDVVSRVLAKRPPQGDSAAARRARHRMLSDPKPSELGPLRKELDSRRGLLEIFGRVAREAGVPLAYGLPVGHGPGFAPLPLGAECRLTPAGRFELVAWEWTGPKT